MRNNEESNFPKELVQLTNQKVFEKVKLQIEKDFLLGGLDGPDSTIPTPRDYLYHLQKALTHWIEFEPELLRNVFYRMDLNEAELINAVVREEEKSNGVEKMSLSILLRQLQKVSSKDRFP